MDDRFEVTLLGTGCPVVSTERYGPGTLVRAGGTTVLVDVGSGVTQRLLAAGSAGPFVDALLVTHIHSDHLVDLYQLIISSWHQNRGRPQRIIGPRGIRVFVKATMAVWAKERARRIAFEKRSSTAAFDMDVTEISGDGLVLAGDGLTVSAILVDHGPVRPAFGFRFDYRGAAIVLSGDTTYAPNLVRQARGADLLVHEVLAHGRLPPGGLRTSEGAANVASYHTLSTEVGRVAAEAEVKALVLTHIVPPSTDRAALIADARRHYAGPVVIGEDLMTINLLNRIVVSGATTFSL